MKSMNKKIKLILKEMDRLYPTLVCELEYEKDYELLLAVMLSSQTTDKRVNQVTNILFKKYPTIVALMNASTSDIEKIIRPIGTFRKKARFIKQIATTLVNDYNGQVPNTAKELEALAGIGHKSANVVLSLLYNIPCIAVDTHVARVSKRWGLVSTSATVIEIEKQLMNLIAKKRWAKSHYQFVLFGRYHCKAIKPNCDNCNLKVICTKDK